MPRLCTICTHADRPAIDQALVSGDPYRRIAAQFTVSETSVRRHAAAHLPAQLITAQHVTELTQADDLLAKIADLEVGARRIAQKAEATGDLRTALNCFRELTRMVELLAKLRGELQDGNTVNVLVLPEWHHLRTLVLDALRPFPEARVAVAATLERLNHDPRP